MSKSSYYPLQYECPNCRRIQKHYVWSNEVEQSVHECTNEDCKESLSVSNIYEEPEVQAPGIKTMTKDRIMLDRKKRSHNHFMREVLPTFPKGSDERRHHLKKNGYKS